MATTPAAIWSSGKGTWRRLGLIPWCKKGAREGDARGGEVRCQNRRAAGVGAPKSEDGGRAALGKCTEGRGVDSFFFDKGATCIILRKANTRTGHYRHPLESYSRTGVPTFLHKRP